MSSKKTGDYLFYFLRWYAPKIIEIIPQIHKIKCIIVEESGFSKLNTKENAKIIIPKITNKKPLYFIFSSSQSFLNILFYYNIFGGKKTSDYLEINLNWNNWRNITIFSIIFHSFIIYPSFFGIYIQISNLQNNKFQFLRVVKQKVNLPLLLKNNLVEKLFVGNKTNIQPRLLLTRMLMHKILDNIFSYKRGISFHYFKRFGAIFCFNIFGGKY